MTVLNFDAKLCEWTRRQLDAYVSNELLVETTSEIVRHLEICETCSRELESRLRVREALRRAVLAHPVPEALRVDVQRRLRQTRPTLFWQSNAARWAVALAGILLVFAGVLATGHWPRFRRDEQMIAAILKLGVSDHLECAIKGHNYPQVANSADQIRKKLGPQYAGLLQIVEQRTPGFQVLEGHVCSIAGSPRKYVHFIARGKGTILSVILTKREGESLPPGRFLVTRAPGGVELYQARLEGMDVVGFESNEYLGFVVSNLGQEDMVQIAAPIAPALRNALDERGGTEKSAVPARLLANANRRA